MGLLGKESSKQRRSKCKGPEVHCRGQSERLWTAVQDEVRVEVGDGLSRAFNLRLLGSQWRFLEPKQTDIFKGSLCYQNFIIS